MTSAAALPPSSERNSKRVMGIIAVAALPLLFLGLLVVAFAAGVQQPPDAQAASPEALADIPSEYLTLYQQAATAQGIDWAVVAGIGKLECDHGRSQLAGCHPPGTVNSAGARGPMQFLGSTWRTSAAQHAPDVAGPPIPDGQEAQGYATDANNNGTADPWEPTDAVHAAARYLRTNGAPDDYDAAIWNYNHSDTYRNDVLRWANTYREAAETPAEQLPNGPVELATVRGITVHAAIAKQLDAMLTAAQGDGVTLAGSGYRSPNEQIELRKQHCGTSQHAIYEMDSTQCSPPTAKPGTSMHEQGLAIDFTNCSTRSTACWQWLSHNAASYGFHQLPGENWHWSTTGQ